MSERLKDFYKKIHSAKNSIPEYASIIIRPGKKIIDLKIKKEVANILKILAHEEKKTGWFLHSVHIPIKNLGLEPNSKNKEILSYLTEPNRITSSKPTRAFLEDILRKYIDILPEKKKHYFKTERFKKKKEFKVGAQLKGF
ncbi:hypothetical protein LCGC14_0575000 [marine sediment metagenome]|uniref:Uncharacterized protein n=1 Tax=marine sediment metagenome TaxID=412755 RepID=A0A0F9S1L1_9ZZZZ|nr:MAG: hypothetical protein Lokiarch_01100 [Candidatus Lokiarchaeum sp. GC14_75]